MWYLDKAIATAVVCALGAYSMKKSEGSTGIGWAILGVAIIWGGL